MTPTISLAIDGNEANTAQRVGSNVYAAEILQAMAKQIPGRTVTATILLSAPPLEHMPPESEFWHYQVVKPARYWTQWAAPLFLERHRDEFDVFFTPSHYAPRSCPMPYVSSVMDTAYLAYPGEFKLRDRIQLTEWTAYSVKKASKVIVISRFTKRCVIEAYKKADKDVIIANPAVHETKTKILVAAKKQYLQTNEITSPYFLYVGTIQPRKRLSIVIEAFERLCTQLVAATSRYRPRKGKTPTLPLLVIAGKVGWLASPVVQRAAQSPFAAQIKLLGYVSDHDKQLLMQESRALILIGRHEGFGIPPLEAMQAGTIPIVARTGSLPEVVGQAGMLVAADDSLQLMNKMKLILDQNARERGVWLSKGRDQVKRFSWMNSADIILDTLETVAMGART